MHTNMEEFYIKATRFYVPHCWICIHTLFLIWQIVIWFVIPALKTRTADYANHTISLIVFIQYVPRFFVIFPLHRQIIKTSGAIAKTAWAGAAYNLVLYILASHVSTKLHFLIFASLLYENAEVTTDFFIT